MSERERRPALILAGGGLKVAFQAGVLQVWLDEAGLDFPIADGSSGGVFNLAMWCQGMSGTEIADTWRQTKPLDFFSLNPRPWIALSSLDRFRRKVLPTWGLDWDRIRATERRATFNVYNFSRQCLRQLDSSEMNEEWLTACVSLPVWFPPVEIDGDTYVDSVYATDANLETAIAAGANELWVIWTVSTHGRWRSRPISHYFQILENAAVWRLKDVLRRIDLSNERLAANEHSEFREHIDVKMLRAEVPLHYLLVFSADRLRDAVELGVLRARAWCRDNGVTLPESLAAAEGTTPSPDDTTRLRFKETMAGTIGFGVQDPVDDARVGAATSTGLAARFTVRVAGVRRFLESPQHEARLEGSVVSDALGGTLPVESGVFKLFPAEQDPRFRRMLYRVFFRDATGHPLTLTGEKLVPSPAGPDPWRDTTTLFTRILRGHVEAREEGAEVASGVLRISLPGFLRQVLTFRAGRIGRRGPLIGGRLVFRYFGFFLGTLARIYLRR